MPSLHGKKWEYRDDNVQAGELTPVSCYVVSENDSTPATPESAGHIWTGFAEVDGWDEVPDANYHNGIRREMRVKGPVVNRNRSVVIDDAPSFVRALHHYQQQ